MNKHEKCYCIKCYCVFCDCDKINFNCNSVSINAGNNNEIITNPQINPSNLIETTNNSEVLTGNVSNNIDVNEFNRLEKIKSVDTGIYNSIDEIDNSLDKIMDMSKTINLEARKQNNNLNILNNNIDKIGNKQIEVNKLLKKQLKNT